MRRSPVAEPDANAELWPAESLSAWLTDPDSAFTAWLAHQRVLGARPLRETTVLTYRAVFTAWVRWISVRQLTLLEATPQDIASFLDDHDPALEPVSRLRYLQLLDKVYAYLKLGAGWSGENPTLPLLAHQGAVTPDFPPGFTDDQVERLLDWLTHLSGWKGERDRAVAALLLGAGLRANELIALAVDAVSPTYRILLTPAGVHREHTTVVLPDGPYRAWLNAWQEARAKHAIPGRLLCPSTLSGKAYSPSGLFRRIDGWMVGAHIASPQRGPNILRNTFAQRALASGRYSLEEVQEFLGHAELRATARHQTLKAA